MGKFRYGTSETSFHHPEFPGIPLVVAEFLKNGAPEGQRNTTLAHVAMQVRDIGHSEGEAIELLIGRAMDIGLTSSEIHKTIRYVYARPAREPAQKPGGGSKIIQHPAYGAMKALADKFRPTKILDADPTKSMPKASYVLTEEDLPPSLDNPTEKYLKALFRMGEKVQLVRAEKGADGREEPTAKGNLQAIMPLENWLDRLEKKGGDCERAIYPADTSHGCYVCINPLKENKRRIEDIADFRYALVEFDNLPRNHQWQLIQQSKIPCAAVVDSGGKSIHAIVKVDAKSLEEYRQRVKLLMEHFKDYGVDAQNIDPTRLSRLPGARRGDTGNLQTLLSEAMGYATFVEWETTEIHDQELPRAIKVSELLAFNVKEDASALIGENRWLCRGGHLVVTGASGMGKSSLTSQMAISWALPERDFFGIKAKQPLRSLVVQAENDDGDLAEGIQGMVSGMELTKEELDILEGNITFHQETCHTGERFVQMMSRLIDKHRPDIVFADPLLSFIGGDISKQEVATAFLRNQLGPVIKQSKVIWVWIHHTGKPASDKSNRKNISNQDLAYAGLGSSELTNWARAMINLERVASTNIFRMTISKRGGRSGLVDENGQRTDVAFIQHAEGKICWVRPDLGSEELEGEVMGTGEKKPKEEKKPAGRPPKPLTPGQEAKIVNYLKDHPCCPVADVQRFIEDTAKISYPTAKKRLNEWFEKGIIRAETAEVDGKIVVKGYHYVEPPPAETVENEG